MHGILRSINQMVKGLVTKMPRLATTKQLLTQQPPVLFRRTSTEEERKRSKTENATRFFESIGGEGKGFECAMFQNPSEKRVVAIFQMGPYLEGPPGFVHGGAIATILDQTVAATIVFLKFKMMISNLNIKYKSPMALHSVVVVDTKVVKIEGRKVFTSSEIRNVDGQTFHVEATSLLIKLQAPSSPQKETDSRSP